MSLNIWNFTDYKKYLRSVIEAQKPARGMIAQLASAAGCQASYLSQVLLKEVQLTPDHALALARHLRLSNDESNYFCLMVDFARAATPLLKEHIKRRMSDLKSANVDVGKRLERAPAMIQEHQSAYYSSWLMSALHIMSNMAEFQTVKAAARRLGIVEDVVERTWKQLETMGFVEQHGERFQYKGDEVHLPKDSPLISLHHQNWRTRAVLSAQALSPEPLHFSGVYSVGKEDLQRLKEIFLQALKDANAIAGPAPSEDLVCISCDVFRV